MIGLNGAAGGGEPALSYAFAKQHGIVVLDAAGPAARVGLREGADPSRLAEARRVLGRPLQVETLSRADFERRLSDLYGGDGLAGAEGAHADLGSDLDSLIDHMPATADLLDTQDDAPIIKLINSLIAEAVRTGASDIHIEPYETSISVRLRVDGVLRDVLTLPGRIAPLLVSRVKVMSRLDIAERRIPQDGRISLALGGKSFDVRVSTLPSRSGERVVMRILDKETAALRLDQLGMAPNVLARFKSALAEPNGIILVTGPTGSGKTTTLYAGLGLLNDRSRNILTIEDPVEYAVQGVGQTQVNVKVGMTFAAGLRAVLRQDPDVVMVGEIRDAETAQIAVQASLTGHLVLSTVHTNDAAGAIVRLRDLGVEPFLLASSIRLILAQRLVRRLCPQCRAPFSVDAGVARLTGFGEGETIYRAVGCPACKGAGYVGRVAVYEALAVNDAMRRLISEGANEIAIADAAFSDALDLRRAAAALVREGVTSLDEVVRVTRQDMLSHAGV